MRNRFVIKTILFFVSIFVFGFLPKIAFADQLTIGPIFPFAVTDTTPLGVTNKFPVNYLPTSTSVTQLGVLNFPACDYDNIENESVKNNHSWPWNTGSADAYLQDQYIEFSFSSIGLPGNAIIDDVIISDKYWSTQRTVTNAKYDVINYDQITGISNTLGSVNLAIAGNGCKKSATDNIDITGTSINPNIISLFDNFASSKIDILKLRFYALRTDDTYYPGNSMTTVFDYLGLTIKYHLPEVKLPIAYQVNIGDRSVDDSFSITLTGTSTDGISVFYTTSTSSRNGSLLALTASSDKVLYTPNGLLGNDSFDFSVTDGSGNIATSTVTLNLITGSSSKLKISADLSTLNVGSSTVLTINSYDKFDHPTINDNSTVVNVSSDFGLINDSILTLTSGIATTTASSLVDGLATFIVSSTSLVSSSTTINFLKPVVAVLVSTTTTIVSQSAVYHGGGGGGLVISNITAPNTHGDINNDGRVDILDLTNIFVHWGENYKQDDFNNDGIVDLLDFNYLMAHWSE